MRTKPTWLRMFWGIAVFLLALALVVERSRGRGLQAAAVELRDLASKMSAEASVYEAHLLRMFRSSNDSISPSPTDASRGPALYVLVDPACPACVSALRSYKQILDKVDLHVGANNASVHEVQTWLDSIGVNASVVSTAHDPFLSQMPLGATPITLEVIDGEPIDLILGQPTTEWLNRYVDSPDQNGG